MPISATRDHRPGGSLSTFRPGWRHATPQTAVAKTRGTAAPTGFAPLLQPPLAAEPRASRLRDWTSLRTHGSRRQEISKQHVQKEQHAMPSRIRRGKRCDGAELV
eukprot:scaffold1397_cov254-Pinguiococcus_pyrenoidosus.AAC.14